MRFPHARLSRNIQLRRSNRVTVDFEGRNRVWYELENVLSLQWITKTTDHQNDLNPAVRTQETARIPSTEPIIP
jgi:hypothetical protein